MKFDISKRALEYLFVQCGDIWHLRDDIDSWKLAYEARIERVYSTMKPALPEKAPAHILDVGGGLSGIGARLCQHYDGKPEIVVADGANNDPVSVKHDKPFNNAEITQDFLRHNGVKKVSFIDVEAREQEWYCGLVGYSLVVSTQSWCFHYPPKVYLTKVFAHLALDGVVIVDVRNGRSDWRHDLREFFGAEKMLSTAPKWTRYAYGKFL